MVFDHLASAIRRRYNASMQGSPNDKLAASLATLAVPTVPSTVTVGEVEQLLLRDVGSFRSIDYIYVVDGGRLVGVASIKDVFRQPKDLPIARVMVRDIASVHPHTHRERIAYLALKRNLKAIPVVGDGGVFLGAVLNDTILKILEQETAEDLLHLAGVGHVRDHYDNVMEMPLRASLGHRLPWLAVGLCGGLLAAGVVGWFEATLQRNLLLASFIPLVVYMADAVGTQMEAFIIRDLAVDQAFKFGRYFRRQLLTVMTMAIALGAAAFLGVGLLYGDVVVATAVALALAMAALSAVITGLCVPYLFKQLRLDPANASGPLATIVQDLMSVTIYFLVASLLV